VGVWRPYRRSFNRNNAKKSSGFRRGGSHGVQVAEAQRLAREWKPK
jgi:hypothetical protein